MWSGCTPTQLLAPALVLARAAAASDVLGGHLAGWEMGSVRDSNFVVLAWEGDACLLMPQCILARKLILHFITTAAAAAAATSTSQLLQHGSRASDRPSPLPAAAHCSCQECCGQAPA